MNSPFPAHVAESSDRIITASNDDFDAPVLPSAAISVGPSRYASAGNVGSLAPSRYASAGNLNGPAKEPATGDAAADDPAQRVPASDHHAYHLLAQRYASSNFIQKIDSFEVMYRSTETVIKMIGPYLLGDQIGKGSFSKVKEAICSETLQRVAVKIVNKKRLRKLANGVENMVREIGLHKRLRHPNVISLLDVFCKVEDEDGNVGVFNWFPSIEEGPIRWKLEDGTEESRNVEVLKWYLVFEHCPVTLQTLLENGTPTGILALPMAHRLFSQLMEGIEYLHDHSVVHRDIKPGNLLITTDGTLKISDFGVSEEFSPYDGREMTATSFAGTHQFLSPEIAEGAPSFLAPKVDVWACGVTLYNMVTGHFPFEFGAEGNLFSLYEQISRAEYELPDTLPAELGHLLSSMLAKSPVERLGVRDVRKHPWLQQRFSITLTNQPLMYMYVEEPDKQTAKQVASPPLSPSSLGKAAPGRGASPLSPASLGTLTPTSPNPSPTTLNAQHPRTGSASAVSESSTSPVAAASSTSTLSPRKLLARSLGGLYRAASRASNAASARRERRNTLRPLKPEAPRPRVHPVTTTVTPYLEVLFANELQADLAAHGNYDRYCWDADELSETLTPAEKLRSWMHAVMGSPALSPSSSPTHAAGVSSASASPMLSPVATLPTMSYSLPTSPRLIAMPPPLDAMPELG